MAESAASATYTDAAAFKISILNTGVFPYRILYQQIRGKIGLGLRWAMETPEQGLSAFSDVPGTRLYTDSYMHDTESEALTGSIAGKCPSAVHDGDSKPMLLFTGCGHSGNTCHFVTARHHIVGFVHGLSSSVAFCNVSRS